ncbi:MAG: hypothetical protein WBO36_06040 [Saprospiraceae bacterium]
MRQKVFVLLLIFVVQVLILPTGSDKYSIEPSEESNLEKNLEIEVDDIMVVYPDIIANNVYISTIPIFYPSNYCNDFFIEEKFITVDTPPPILI